MPSLMGDNMADKPFTQDYVIELTVKNCNRDIDVSINKTLSRMEELKTVGKSGEGLETIMRLQNLKDHIKAFEANATAEINSKQ